MSKPHPADGWYMVEVDGVRAGPRVAVQYNYARAALFGAKKRTCSNKKVLSW